MIEHIKFTIKIGLILCLASFVFAATEPLPQFDSEAQKKTFLTQWQRQIPFSTFANIDFLNRQINSLQALRNRFPQYDKWMSEKPDPIEIDVFKVEKAFEQTLSLEPSLLEYVRNFTAQNFINETHATGQTLVSADEKNELEYRAYVTLAEVLKGSENSIRGIIVGLAQLLPPQDRTAFFKIGNANDQIELISKLNLSDELLRQSSFRPEALGLTKETITFSKLVETARYRIQGSERIFLALSYLKFLQRLKEANHIDTPQSPESLKSVLGAEDFDFAYKANSDFIKLVLQKLATLQLVSPTVSEEKIINFQNSFSKLRFSSKLQTVPKNILVAKVFEVPPHLGAHRGSIGGDCSSSCSPMYPFSPWEHDYFIQNPEGVFIGYVSATRVQSDGIETFYLKDLSGRNLSAPVAEAVLHAFAKIFPYYGAKRFAIASPRFTDKQNHFSILIEMLKRYNREGSPINLVFHDHEIRHFIGGNNSIFASTNAYDSPAVHRQGIVFPRFPETEAQFSAKYKKGTLPIPEIKSVSDSFIHLLRVKAANPKAEVAGLSLSDNEVRNALRIIENRDGEKLGQYYKNVSSLFANYQIELNKSFISKNESIFLRGHLMARDAFKTTDESLLNTSERYFSQLARSHIDYSFLMELAKKWKARLENSPRIDDLFQLYSERLATQDVFQLYGFAEIGFIKARRILENPGSRPRIELAIEALLGSHPSNFGLPIFKNDDNNKSESIAKIFYTLKMGYYNSNSIATLTERLDKAFIPFQFNWRKVENDKFRNIVELAFIRQNDSMSTHYRLRTTQLLKNHILDGSASRFEIIDSLRKLLNEPDSFKQVASVYFEKVRKLQEPLDYGTLHLLAAWGYTPALELIQTPEVQKSYLHFLDSYAFGTNNNEPLRSDKSRMASFYNDNNQANPFNVVSSYLQRLEISSGPMLKQLEKIAKDLFVRHEDLQKSTIFLQHVGESWLKLRDAFNSPDEKKIELTLNIEFTKMKNLDFLPENRFFNSIDYLKQKAAFSRFISILESAFMNDGCKPCGETLITLIAMGKIKDNISKSPEAIKKLIAMDSTAIVLYATHEAMKRNIPITPSESMIQHFSQATDFSSSRIVPAARALFQDWAIDALINYSADLGDNKQFILKKLEYLMMKEPINSKALKFGMAFVRQGGSPYFAQTSLTKIYPRSELFTQTETAEGEIYKRLLAVPSSAGPMSCKSVFANRAVKRR